MYCSKCGAELPDEAKFCTTCGASTEDNGEVMNYEPNVYENNEIITPGSSHKKAPKAVLGVIAAIVIVLMGGFLAKAQFMRTFMPKTYVEYSMLNTANKLEKEVNELKNEILGFEIDENSDFTTSLNVHVYENDADINSSIAYVGSKDKLSFDASAKANGESISANLIWDNKKIGFALPELIDDKYITVDAKNFGKQVYNSDFRDARDYISEDADISFKNIFKSSLDVDSYSELSKKLKKELANLIKAGEVIEKDKTEIKIDGKDKKVHSAEIRFDGNDIKDCLLNCIDIISDDEEFNKTFSTVKSDMSVDDILDELKDEIRDSEFIDSFEIKFLTYKDYLVGVEFDIDDEDVSLEFNFNSIKNMLDLWQIKTESNDEEFRIYSEGNIIPVKNQIDYTIAFKSDDSYYSSGKVSLSADLNNGGYKFRVTGNGDELFSVGGDCSNKKGFSVSLKNDYVRAELSVTKGAKFNKISELDDYMIFEHSEDELEDDFSKYEDNYYDVSDALEEIFDMF